MKRGLLKFFLAAFVLAQSVRAEPVGPGSAGIVPLPVKSDAFQPQCPSFEVARTTFIPAAETASAQAFRTRVERNFQNEAARFMPEIKAVQPFALKISAKGKVDQVIGDIFHFSSIPFAWEAARAIRARAAGFDPAFAPHFRLERSRNVIVLLVRPHPDQFPPDERGIGDFCFDRIEDVLASEAAKASKKETEPLRETKTVEAFIQGTSFDSLLLDSLDDNALDGLKDHPNLESVALVGDRITSEGYRKLEVLRETRVVSVGPGRVTDEGLSGLRNMSHARRLLAGFCRISDKGLSALEGMTELEDLSLRGNEIRGTGLKALAKMTSLRTLGLNWNPVTDGGLAALPVLPALETIFLADSNVSDAGMKHLAKQPKLRYAVLRRTKVGDAGLDELAKAPSLEALELIDARASSAGIARFKAARPGVLVITRESTKEDFAALAALEKRLNPGP